MRDIAAVGGRSVIFPLCVEGGYEAENRRVIEEAGAHAGVLVPFARIDPRVSGGAETAAALAAGARGIKLHPRGEDFRLEHPNVDGIFAAAAEAGAPVLIHAGAGVGSFGADPHRAGPAPPALPDRPRPRRDLRPLLDLARASRPPQRLLRHGLVEPADLRALFALVPPGRILFGTDAPYMDVGLGLAFTLRSARTRASPADAIELVMGAQLEALLAGAAPIDGGPAPGPRRRAARRSRSGCMALLGAAGGCMLGGGDPGDLLGLAAAATEVGPAGRAASSTRGSRGWWRWSEPAPRRRSWPWRSPSSSPRSPGWRARRASLEDRLRGVGSSRAPMQAPTELLERESSWRRSSRSLDAAAAGEAGRW